jgi:hypothetical protein
MAAIDGEKQEAEEPRNRPPPGLLNENHRRVLTNTIRRVELAAWRLEEQLTRGESPQLALTRFIHPPGPQQRSALLQLAQQLRREIAQLASDYDLEMGEQDLLRTIMAEFSLLWSDLEEAKTQKLRAYGTINPQAHTILGPRIQRLVDLVLAIDGVANGRYDTLLAQQATERTDI